MLLSITSTSRPATDLGYLLHKNPARIHHVEIAAGSAHVFYPTAEEDRCTAVLMLDLDPVALVRELRGPRGEDAKLAQYVNDRPYVASSFLSVAIARAYKSALNGQSRERPDLIARAFPLEATLTVVRCTRGETLLRELFEPLGYAVEVESHLLDAQFPEWGTSPYFTMTLRAEVTVQALLQHLYVLIPVLDDEKHYWVSSEEIEKLLRAGAGWLKDHPARELISKRYLRHQARLVTAALERLTEDEAADVESKELAKDADEQVIEQRISLHERRIEAVLREIDALGPARVIDLGCGEGRLLRELMRRRGIAAVAGMDVSAFQLERAVRRLKIDRMADFDRARLTLFHGSLMYRDARLAEYDVATLVEVIEHLDPPRLRACEQVVFGHARPRVVIVTTPNIEYNALFERMPAGTLRHRDHRFEWTRAEFGAWAANIGSVHAYRATFHGIGDADATYGAPTQMAVFTREDAA